MTKDTQLVELAGRHWLIGQLLTYGLEVATPVRDRGVDLVVYQDRLDSFRALPVQLKAATEQTFSLHTKYSKTSGLVLAYVWNVRPSGVPTAYALTVPEALGVGAAMGYTKTPSWEKGAYATTRPSKKLIGLLEPFASDQKRWHALLGSLPKTVAPSSQTPNGKGPRVVGAGLQGA